MYIYIYIHIYIYMHMCTYIYIYIMHICAHIYIYVSVYIYMCVCVCVFRHIHWKKYIICITKQYSMYIHVYTNVFIYIQSTKLHPADLAAMILIWLQGQRSDICGWHSQFPRHFQADRQFGAGQMFKYIHFLKTSAIGSVTCDGGRMAATGAVRRVAWEQRFGLKRLGTHDFTNWIGPIG